MNRSQTLALRYTLALGALAVFDINGALGRERRHRQRLGVPVSGLVADRIELNLDARRTRVPASFLGIDYGSPKGDQAFMFDIDPHTGEIKNAVSVKNLGDEFEGNPCP